MNSRWGGVVIAIALAGCSLPGSSPNVPDVALESGRAPAASGALGTEKVLYSFQSGADGVDPEGTLVADASGALYGTTAFGGTGDCFEGCGTVFQLKPKGAGYVKRTLYSFGGPDQDDGAGPAAGLTLAAGGKLFGTTEYGGNAAGDGTVFELAPNGQGYDETVLYRFGGGNDGTSPIGGVTRAGGGNLFGATLLGGGGSCASSEGCGVVFELKPSGSSYVEQVVHRFTGGRDGATPGSPPLALSGGRLYGVTATGGGDPSCGSAPINRGCGTMYALVAAGSSYAFHVLHRFAGAPHDAANAFGGLVAGSGGTLYAVSQYGGSANQGAAVKLARHRDGTFSSTLIHSFTGGLDGSYPLAALAIDTAGTLYGTAQYGGSPRNAGIAFALSSSGNRYAEKILYRFRTTAAGLYPVGGLLPAAGGTLYGTTTYGGNASAPGGVVFRLTP